MKRQLLQERIAGISLNGWACCLGEHGSIHSRADSRLARRPLRLAMCPQLAAHASKVKQQSCSCAAGVSASGAACMVSLPSLACSETGAQLSLV